MRGPLGKRLLRMLWHTKGQVVAITAVLALGLLAFVTMHMTISNLDATVKRYYELTRMPHLVADVMRLPEARLEELSRLPGVAAVQGRVVQDVKVALEDENERSTLRLVSLQQEAEPLSDIYLVAGRRPQAEGEVALLMMYARARQIALEDIVTVVIGGRKRSLRVVGIVSNPEYIYLIEDEQTLLPDPKAFGVGYITERFAQSLFGYKKAYNRIMVMVAEGADQDAVKTQMDKALERFGVLRLLKRLEIISVRMVNEEIVQDKKMANVIPVIFLLVAGAIIAVVLGRMVQNDRLTIGILKAMGYANWQILWHYTQYAAGIGLVGALVGMVSGALLAHEMTTLYTETVFDIPILIGRLYPEYMVLAMGLGAVFCIAAGLFGARGVLKIHPAEAMRPEAPRTGKRILLERLGPLWRRVSFSWKVVLRSIFRSKRRGAFIALGITLTYVSMMLPFYMWNAFLEMFDRQYGQMYHMDLQIAFSRPMDETVVNDVKAVLGDDARAVEPLVEFPFEIQYHWKAKVVNILGVAARSRMYSFFDVSGQPIALPERGIALTEGLAKYLRVSVGDSVDIKTFVPGRDNVAVTVTAIVEQPLGLNAYMNLQTLQRQLLGPHFVNGALVQGAVDANRLDSVRYVQSAQSQADMMAIFKQFTTITYSAILLMVFSAGLLGYAIVYNAATMSIHERSLEFSALRVLGFDQNQIFSMLAREHLLMSVVGIALGVPLGGSLLDRVMATFSTELYTMKVGQEPLVYVVTAVATLFFVGVSLAATFGKIHRLDFIEALKARVS